MTVMHYYTYEYGWIDANEAVHVYRSQDGAIGIKVRHQRTQKIWSEGYSRFFVWGDESSGTEFDRELQARASLASLAPRPLPFRRAMPQRKRAGVRT